MSFFLTTPQFIDGSKDVTRRLGWWNTKEGDKVMAVKKSQGRKPGEKIQYLGPIILFPKREPLQAMLDDAAYGQSEVIREGFPHFTPAQFVEMLCDFYKVKAETVFNRIEFKRATQ